MSGGLIFALVCAVLALVYGAVSIKWILAQPEGNERMREIAGAIRAWIADSQVDVVVSTGGTGVTGRDVTPEAVESLLEKRIDGFGEMFRWISWPKIGTSTIQSRAVGGVAGGTYVFALPGSPSACRDGWEEILKWQLDNRHRPCNLVELMPRLQEHLATKPKATV